MRCPVCGKLHEAVECPRCSFPDVHIVGDWETEIAKLAPVIRQYRTDLLESVRLQLPVYSWKDRDGVLVEQRQDWSDLGSCLELLTPRWSPRKFARIPEVPQLTVTVRVLEGQRPREVAVTLPNLDVPQLQELGAVVEEDLTFRLLLRCQGQEPVSSPATPLFD